MNDLGLGGLAPELGVEARRQSGSSSSRSRRGGRLLVDVLVMTSDNPLGLGMSQLKCSGEVRLRNSKELGGINIFCGWGNRFHTTGPYLPGHKVGHQEGPWPPAARGVGQGTLHVVAGEGRVGHQDVERGDGARGLAVGGWWSEGWVGDEDIEWVNCARGQAADIWWSDDEGDEGSV